MARIFVRAITPKRAVGIDPKWIKANLEKELKDLGKQVVKEFKKPVAKWKGPPEFTFDIVGSGNLITMAVQPYGPNAEKFNWVDQGTEMRTIRPRRRGFLRFQPKYSASTRPGSMSSRTAKRGGGWRTAQVVRNKIDARDFSGQVYRKFNPEFRRRMNNFIRRGLRASSP